MLVERPATSSDLDAVVALTKRNRHRLAEWHPTYFNPRDGADEAHAGWLGFLLGSDDFDTRVLVAEDGSTVGFWHLVAQAGPTWVDDLCVGADDLWPAVGPRLRPLPAPWVTCVPIGDASGAEAVLEGGAAPVSTFYRTTLDPLGQPAADQLLPPPIDGFEPSPQLHVFGDRPFGPDQSGALVATDDRGGYAVASPSASPPIYDPGGPSCVVDTVRGDDRRALLQDLVRQAEARGDAQMIVVCPDADAALVELLDADGFDPVVRFYSTA